MLPTNPDLTKEGFTMTNLRAGFGRADITPKIGSKMVGYGNRLSHSTGVHDPLLARALVLEDDGGAWAIVSCDLCYTNAETVAAIRAAVQQRTEIPPAHVLVVSTHTHSGPHDLRPQNWDRPLAEMVADAVAMAYQARQPARIASGYGFLYGHSINRRWLDRPIDPGVTVLRVDDANGKLLGLFTNFGNHSVVLGYDNYLLSGDWPGFATRKLEADLGDNVTVLFSQGGAGDINPLTEGVRQRLRSGQTIWSIGRISHYYGTADDPNNWTVEDRGGGTFAEAETIGHAFAEEVAYVVSRLQSTSPDSMIWSEQLTINAAAAPGEHPSTPPPYVMQDEQPPIADPQNIPAELMILGIGALVLVTEPGEVFSETAINLKIHLRALGYKIPALVSYANGWLLYLPEPAAFSEGGYEVNWPVTLNISKQFQPRVRQAIEDVLQQRAPRRDAAA